MKRLLLPAALALCMSCLHAEVSRNVVRITVTSTPVVPWQPWQQEEILRTYAVPSGRSGPTAAR